MKKPYITLACAVILASLSLTGASGQGQYPAYKIALGAENRCAFAVKTNLLLLGINAMANAGGELFLPSFKGHYFSIDASLAYSPYTVSGNWKFRVFAFQPEFRWWIQRKFPSGGYFVGLHTHLAWYNVATDRLNYYQDRNGTTPLWGAGISYGYAMALPWWNNFSVEFTLGAGYARLDYDVYYNIPNGAKHASGTKNYWGLTRGGISLVYRFN